MTDSQTEQTSARLYRVIVPVPDIDAAVRFYGDLLEQPGERVAETRHYFDCGGVVLACVVPAEGHSATAHFRPLPDYFYFAVPDLEAALARARRAGADVTSEIQSYPWGERSFYMRDPFGNPLCFVDDDTLFLGRRSVD